MTGFTQVIRIKIEIIMPQKINYENEAIRLTLTKFDNKIELRI